MTELIENRLIEQLVSKRAKFINLMGQQFTLLHQCHSLCGEMDALIPAHKNAIHDYLDIVFIQLRSELGEKSVRFQPRDANVLNKSIEEFQAMFTKILDINLWSILFNRLNVFSIMSKSSRESFGAQLKEKPLEFSVSNVTATLVSLTQRQDDILIESLMQSVLEGSKTYASNDEFRFNKKTVFDEVSSCSAGYVTLSNHSHLYDTLRFLSRVAFGEEINSKEQQLKHPYLWQLVVEHHEATDMDTFFGEPIAFSGGKIIFFKKGTAHLVLEEELVNLLNNRLSQTKALYSKSSSTKA